MRRWHVGVAVAVLFVVAYVFGRCDNGRAERERQWQERVDAALAQTGAFRDSLRASERRERGFMAAYDSLGAVASTRRALIVRLRGDLAARDTGVPHMPDSSTGGILDTIFAQQDSLVWALSGQAQACRAAWEVCQARTSMSEARADSLTALLRQGVKIGQCRVLFVAKCPSRTTAAFGASALTVLILGATGHLK